MVAVQKHTGIVLKSYLPQQHKLALLDERLGRINIMSGVLKHKLVQGLLLEYYPERSGRWAVVSGVEIIAEPRAWAQHDLLFFHHVLEICYFFVPLESVVRPVFDMVKALYVHHHELQSAGAKKLFLCRLFACLGLYPEDEALHTPSMHRLLSVPIESMFEERIGADVEQELHRWLVRCIAVHPQVNMFKTMQFYGWV